MVQEQQDGTCRGREVLQVATLDTEGAVAAGVGDGEGVVVDLIYR